MPATNKPKAAASSKDDDDMKQVAELIDWNSYNGMLGRVFYERFGKLVEKKVAEFEEQKQLLKDCIRRNLGPNNMATPKRPIRIAATLTQQICDMKKLALNSSESESEDVDMDSDEDVAEEASVNENTDIASESGDADVSVGEDLGGAMKAKNENVNPVNEPRVDKGRTSQPFDTNGNRGTIVPKLKQKTVTTNTNKATCSKTVVTVQEKMKYKKTVILTSSDDEMDHVTVSNMNADIFTVTETVNTVRTIEPKQGQDEFMDVSSDIENTDEIIDVGVIEPKIPDTAPDKRQPIDNNRGKPTFSKSKPKQLINKPEIATNKPVSPPLSVRKEIQKEVKMKVLKEKEANANIQREALLKDKADRARREREERQRKVEEKKRVEELKKKERDQQFLDHQERVRLFTAQQRLPHLGMPKSVVMISPLRLPTNFGTPFNAIIGKQVTPAANKAPAKVQRQPIPTQIKLVGAKTTTAVSDNNSEVGNGNKKNVIRTPPTPPATQPKKIGQIIPANANLSPVTTKKLPAPTIPTNISVNSTVSGNATDHFHTMNSKSYYCLTNVSANTTDSNAVANQQQPKKKLAASQMMTSTPKTDAPPINPDHEMTPMLRVINSPVSTGDDTYNITTEKMPLPSTEDDYNINDLSSADETDDDERPRKIVPKWAQKEGMLKESSLIIRKLPLNLIENYFGAIHQPVIDHFFKNKRKYKARKSSAIWNSPLSDPTPGEGKFDHLVDNKAKN